MSQAKLSSPLLPGEVALVGAGPGDPDLLTVAALKLIGDCDAIVYDALVGKEILKLADARAECIFAGKRGGRPSAHQADICATMIRLAKQGKRVVRLKGGDPFIFGRGGEEARHLLAAGIRFRIIPGITSGIAAPAMAGIPLTDRDVNSTLAFLTGHEASEESRINWPAVVSAFPVMVFYMAAKNLSCVARRLMDAGCDPKTPLAAVHAATLEEETVIIGTLEEAANRILRCHSPSIVVVGEVVAKRTPWP